MLKLARERGLIWPALSNDPLQRDRVQFPDGRPTRSHPYKEACHEDELVPDNYELRSVRQLWMPAPLIEVAIDPVQSETTQTRGVS